MDGSTEGFFAPADSPSATASIRGVGLGDIEVRERSLICGLKVESITSKARGTLRLDCGDVVWA
jgi:hypothetical protein